MMAHASPSMINSQYCIPFHRRGRTLGGVSRRGNFGRSLTMDSQAGTSGTTGNGYAEFNPRHEHVNGTMLDDEVGTQRYRAASNSPERQRKFRFVETTNMNRYAERRENVSPGRDNQTQVRKSPRTNPPPAPAIDEPSPEGPTERYMQVGEETPTGRSRWTDEKESLLCSLWEDEEHLYNATMEDHRRNDRRREAIRRIAARLGVEGRQGSSDHQLC